MDLRNQLDIFDHDPARLAKANRAAADLVLTPEDLALWDRRMRRVVEPGMFRVMIGAGSEDIRQQGEFEVQP